MMITTRRQFAHAFASLAMLAWLPCFGWKESEWVFPIKSQIYCIDNDFHIDQHGNIRYIGPQERTYSIYELYDYISRMSELED